MHPAAAIATTRPGASARRPAYNATAPLTTLPSFNYDQLLPVYYQICLHGSPWSFLAFQIPSGLLCNRQQYPVTSTLGGS